MQDLFSVLHLSFKEELFIITFIFFLWLYNIGIQFFRNIRDNIMTQYVFIRIITTVPHTITANQNKFDSLRRVRFIMTIITRKWLRKLNLLNIANIRHGKLPAVITRNRIQILFVKKMANSSGKVDTTFVKITIVIGAVYSIQFSPFLLFNFETSCLNSFLFFRVARTMILGEGFYFDRLNIFRIVIFTINRSRISQISNIRFTSALLNIANISSAPV